MFSPSKWAQIPFLEGMSPSTMAPALWKVLDVSEIWCELLTCKEAEGSKAQQHHSPGPGGAAWPRPQADSGWCLHRANCKRKHLRLRCHLPQPQPDNQHHTWPGGPQECLMCKTSSFGASRPTVQYTAEQTSSQRQEILETGEK